MIESEFRVREWRAGDIDLWPLASQDLFLDLFRQTGADTAANPPTFALRAAASAATPLLNLWKSRDDLRHWIARPHRADALLLGDGVSLDCVHGTYSNRYGEPVAAELERQGRSCFVMEPGDLTRLPWGRPTYAGNQIFARSALAAAIANDPLLNLPDHLALLQLLEGVGVPAPSLSSGRLARRARVVAAQGAAFERILRRVRPKAAFVVTYYAGLGHAFALACRRAGILCVDLQHCPHEGTHRAYRWSKLPPSGYSTLPALFWTWTEEDAANIQRWADRLDQPWHRAIAGGHAQIAGLPPCQAKRLWEAALQSTRDENRYEREIVVALQPIGGKRDLWSALSAAIESAPASWRWWIRRHPASTPEQDASYGRLLSLRSRNVVIGAGAQIPLPALLGHMDALVSLASGAASEAAMFGVPGFFLDAEANDTFPGLIARGQAQTVAVQSLVGAISVFPRIRRHRPPTAPPLENTLAQINRLAEDYARLARAVVG